RCPRIARQWAGPADRTPRAGNVIRRAADVVCFGRHAQPWCNEVRKLTAAQVGSRRMYAVPLAFAVPKCRPSGLNINPKTGPVKLHSHFFLPFRSQTMI